VSVQRERFDLGVRALREMTATPADGGATRSRVLSRLADQPRRRRTHELVLLAIVLLSAVPAVSAGWKYLSRAPDQANSATGSGVSRRQALPPQAGPHVDEPGIPATGESELSASPPPVTTPARATAEASAPAKQPKTEVSDLDLYGRAHEAHFHENNFRKALRLWMEYADRYPQGRFLPEAQFNRAVCLLRMGDRQAARRVLAKLVKSPTPDHPKDDAERLLAEIR